MACPACGCKCTYQFDGPGDDLEQADENTERCAACGHVFDIEDHTDEDDETDEDRNREYLRQRPAYEMLLWQDWILTICEQRKLERPSGYEWDILMANFHHGKMPITSVGELVEIRKKRG